MSSIRPLVLPMIAALAGWLGHQPVWADPSECDALQVTVDTNDDLLRSRVCGAVAKAIPELKACHLYLKRPLKIRFSDTLKIEGEDCFGIYNDGSDRIDLLTPEAFEKSHVATEYWNALTPSQHYDSVLVHELTHALIDQYADQNLQCGIDHEYVAYAMQLASLSSSARDNFFAEVQTSRHPSAADVNQVMYALSPWSFAAGAWLHFSRPGNGCDFVGEILRGETTFWFDDE